MDTPEALRFAHLARDLHDQDGFEETVDLLVESAPALVGSDCASVLMARHGRLEESDPGTSVLADKADSLQIALGEGPAFNAVSEQRTIVSVDLSSDKRWTQWAPAVSVIGVGSVLSVRLWTAAHTLGVITLYAERPRAFDPDSVAIAEILGRHASVALAAARQEESLSQAIDARKLVGQAQGILMERFDLDDRKAFDVLRRYSQTTNTKLNEVARLLVSTRTLPDL
ncbi:GAF and ANTAR domain-containing protein [Nocardioides cavernaquae]|uniref:ANTAR domain-containing protein n=1 Tax=Nocardioides cavernaquae TaxID=2321396 RepID=A0A3A5H9U1_9ACTN|nr:GAF and ANTAR domain-containing protein [Nocardioides cavernaquae]RJS47409.1 ANTAR domain-containing protein [Nocardioides cavernaquae]